MLSAAVTAAARWRGKDRSAPARLGGPRCVVRIERTPRASGLDGMSCSFAIAARTTDAARSLRVRAAASLDVAMACNPSCRMHLQVNLQIDLEFALTS